MNSNTGVILKSFRDGRKGIVYEQNDSYKTLSKTDEFYSTTTDNLLDLISPVIMSFDIMKIGRDKSFYWSGNINKDIKWIFSIGNESVNDGLFLSMNLLKVDDDLLDGLKKVTIFFNGQFKTDIIKKMHSNAF